MAEYHVRTERTDAAGQPVVNSAAAAQHAVGGDDFTGDEPHLPHKPADDTEQIYFEGSPMLRAEIGRGIFWILLGVIVIAAPIAASVWEKHSLPWWIYLAAVIVGLVLFLIPWLRVKSVRYRISNYRIDYQRGLIGRSIDTLELWHVEDVRFYQSILDRILGVGSITVLSHDDTTPKLVLRGLPNPRPLFDSIKQRIIAVKRQRGVVKMDTGS
jgi:membrane protein YdbS with pleckstrin-like domain